MVHTSLYCPEQITIPENFPEILKNYTKAALRTQPYDLLRWSATYFRCLQMGIPPPVKSHYERNVKYGSVTKEYLRVLVKQVGKGFFISRSLLFQRWEGLCLPQDELLKYLSLCRMLHWPQIHWLKLLSVMVGFMNKSPLDTMIMLCELLTENIEGAEAYIPIWMFRICYTFLAELDCSNEQKFIDGRKLLPNGELEDEIRMKAIPEICSPSSLRKAVLEECKNRYTGKCNIGKENTEKEENIGNENDEQSMTSGSQVFEFSQTNWEPKNINDRCGDFDSIMLLLREAQGAKLHEYDGPVKITQNQIRHSIKKDNKIKEEREKQSELYEQHKKQELFEQQMKIIKDVGPPWTWLHEFASENRCIDKSYNFIETESIISDITPALSSDESFDFDKEKQITDITSESDDAITVISKQETINTDDIEKLLFENENVEIEKDEEENELKNLENCLRDTLMEIEIEGGNLKKTESVISYLRKEALEVLEKSGEKATKKINLLEVAKILEQAYQKGVNFENLDEMIDYIKKLYPELTSMKSTPCETPHVDLTSVTKEIQKQEMESKVKEEVEVIFEASVKDTDEETEKKEVESEVEIISEISAKETDEELHKESNLETLEKKTDEKDEEKQDDKVLEEKSQNLDIGKNDQTSTTASTEESISEDSGKVDQKESNESVKTDTEKTEVESIESVKIEEMYPKKKEGNIMEIFEASGMDVDKQIVEDIINDNLILGLVEVPEECKTVAEESPEEIESTITETSSDISMLGNIHDDSSLQPSLEMSAPSTADIKEDETSKVCDTNQLSKTPKKETKIRPNAFECTIPSLPGIGPAVSKRTIQNFLTYLKGKSLIQNGMVCPRNFKEPNCPNMIDCDE